MREQKRALRRQIREKNALIPLNVRAVSDGLLWERLQNWTTFQEARCLFLYAGADWEPDTRPIAAYALSHGIRLGYPLCGAEGKMEVCEVSSLEELRLGPHDVLQPPVSAPRIALEEISVTLVPGMAFDRRGYRLGRGGGYYDRFLRRYAGLSAALCRSMFLMDSVPVEGHDRSVNIIFTEHETLRFMV